MEVVNLEKKKNILGVGSCGPGPGHYEIPNTVGKVASFYGQKS